MAFRGLCAALRGEDARCQDHVVDLGQLFVKFVGELLHVGCERDVAAVASDTAED